MAFLSENAHMRRLAENAVHIKRTYIADGKLFYRDTNGEQQDDVSHGICCRKEYFVQGKPVHVENIFDSRVEYTYVSGMEDETSYTCANCGFTGKVREFAGGCPYCDAASNLDYADKELGGKYHYDLVLKKPLYKLITAAADYVVSLLLAWLLIVSTSRTFNSYDVAKIFLYGTILAMVLYYFFYLCDAYLVPGPIRRYKERLNRKQMAFWSRTGFDKKRFFNNLNYELAKKYYSLPGVIDYDVMDYTDLQEYQKNGRQQVNVTLEVWVVYLVKGRVRSHYKQEKLTLRRNERIVELGPGIHAFKCPNCNANLDLTRGTCEYCGTEIGSLQEWLLVRDKE